MVIVFSRRTDPSVTRTRRTRLITAAGGYLVLLGTLLAAAVLGIVPGTGRIAPADDWLGHGYRLSMGAAIAGLAVYIGLWAAGVGHLVGRWTAGLWALLAAGFLTGIVLGFAPMMRYPTDRYPVTLLWLLLGAPLGALAWLAAVGIRHRREAPTTPETGHH